MPAAVGVVGSSSIYAVAIPKTGLLWWYDADDPTTIAVSGGYLLTWQDKSGAGRHLFANLGNTTVSTGTIKAGRGSVDMTGTQMLMTNSGTANQKPFTIFAVIKHSASAVYRAIIGCYNSGGLEWRISNAQVQSIVKQYVVEIGSGGGVVPANVAVVLGLTYSATGVLFAYLDGTQVYTTTNDQAFNASTARTQVGDGLGEAFIGSFGELIEYDSVLSTTDRQTIENYLIAKWK